LVGAAVSSIGILGYLRNTLKGTSKPNRVSFLILGISPMIAVAAALADGVTWAVVPTFMSGIGPLLIFAASFLNPNAYWKLRRFDYVCGFFSVLALFLWAITAEPLIAIIFAVVDDALACIPTLVKAWSHPHTETGWSYLLALFSALTGYAALQSGAPSEYIFTTYLVIANTSLFLVSYNHKIRHFFQRIQGDPNTIRLD
jgi:hypothetical protein